MYVFNGWVFCVIYTTFRHFCDSVAIDKALAYIDTGDLPWDMDLPPEARLRQKEADAVVSIQEESDGSESSSDSPEEEEEEEEEEEAGDADGDSDSKGDESESSEGEEVDVTTNKKRFMENLRKLHQKRGTPIIRHPVLGQKDVDLYQLHQYVTDYGGMEKVCGWVHIQRCVTNTHAYVRPYISAYVCKCVRIYCSCSFYRTFANM